jgi:hypothetical protein
MLLFWGTPELDKTWGEPQMSSDAKLTQTLTSKNTASQSEQI